MSAVPKPKRISVEEYLAGELISPVKHEYLGGMVYAMAGARNVHNLIKLNLLAFLHPRLRGRPCRPYDSDTKIRIHLPGQVRFYYPDASVTCRPNPQDDSYQDEPVLIAEVLSDSTRRLDEGEKKDAYLTIPSLSVYLLIEQETPAAFLYRRIKGSFVREDYAGLQAEIPLGEIETALPLAEIYDAVEFARETQGEAGH